MPLRLRSSDTTWTKSGHAWPHAEMGSKWWSRDLWGFHPCFPRINGWSVSLLLHSDREPVLNPINRMILDPFLSLSLPLSKHLNSLTVITVYNLPPETNLLSCMLLCLVHFLECRWRLLQRFQRSVTSQGLKELVSKHMSLWKLFNWIDTAVFRLAVLK